MVEFHVSNIPFPNSIQFNVQICIIHRLIFHIGCSIKTFNSTKANFTALIVIFFHKYVAQTNFANKSRSAHVVNLF